MPVVDRQDAVAFESALVEVNAKRQELQTQLDRLDSFQSELGEALVSGAIRAAPG
ncbi:DNA-binding protein [Corynebacterium diphtheriae]|nr:DNA-binding protein [Corynebacterium diphtheriae]CAB1027814.1 DNA-binding protein [Corynebacterium diphtheriae]